MHRFSRLLTFAVFSIFLAGVAIAGDLPAGSVVTASAAADGIRVSAAAEMVRVRVQAFAPGGALLYDSGWRNGNVFDWALRDGFGHELAYGSYRVVAMSSDVAGHVAVRSGTLDVRPDRVEISGEELAAGDAPAMVRVAHTGEAGQIVTTVGALSFRFGDFLARNDVEAMRLSAEGNLDVGGVIRAGRGIQFSDGTIQTTATIPSVLRLPSYVPSASVSGTGTINKLTKWQDTGGTLTDSAVSEVAGKVVIGTISANGQLQVLGAATSDVFSGMGTDIAAGPAMNYGYSGNSFGRGSGFFNVRPDASATAPNPSLRFMTTNAQRMIITNLGNVGINTGFTPATAPTDKLEVNGNVKLVGGGHGFIFADSTLMTTAGATLGANTFNGTQSITGNVAATGSISGASASFSGDVSTGGIVNAGTQFNINGQRELVQPSNNLFVGTNAGAAWTTGASLVFIGVNAGAANTTASQNTMVGWSAGQDTTTGANNAFFGSSAGMHNTTAAANTYFGCLAGTANTTGFFNSYFGQAAGYFALGLENTFVGSNSGQGASNTNTGDYNCFVGAGSGLTITSGSFNTFIGTSSGANNTSGGANTFIGDGAGLTNTTESFNTVLGTNADTSAGISNATAIGAFAKATQSNTVVLGSINGVNNALVDALVGIQTSTPNEALGVGGGVTVDARSLNDGTFLPNSALTFGTAANNTLSGEGIASQRGGAGNNLYGLDFYTLYTKRMSVAQNGNVTIYGNLNVQGGVSKGGGSFKIDHPLDPENKYLYHSFVESPDMKDVYDGVVRLDASGAATVQLPEWFEALNGDFRYQLTSIGKPSPNLYVAEEVANHQFKVAGGAPGAKVSWQVTGIRHDTYAKAHPIPIEEPKPLAERGRYLYPPGPQPPAEGMARAPEN